MSVDKRHVPHREGLGFGIYQHLMESAIKQLSQRVKGTEKFWRKETVEAVLQLRADFLSGSHLLPAFWKRWQENITGAKCCRVSI